MYHKFELAVFVPKDRRSYYEYASLAGLLRDLGPDVLAQLSGWFPPHSNVTYRELAAHAVEEPWYIALLSTHGERLLLTAESTTQVRQNVLNYLALCTDYRGDAPAHATFYPAARLLPLG